MITIGTNFYLMTKNKEHRDLYFGYDYELTDVPDWGYQIHIAKTSCGWLPLFQAHRGIESVKQLKDIYHAGEFIIADEYGTVYSWDEFDKRVLQFNGGVQGRIPREKVEQELNRTWYDYPKPEYLPISHFEYDHGRYASAYFIDPEGYEFTIHEFS